MLIYSLTTFFSEQQDKATQNKNSNNIITRALTGQTFNTLLAPL